MKKLRQIETNELFQTRVKFYSFRIEPCSIVHPDGHEEKSWWGGMNITLESGEEVTWEYGGNDDAGVCLSEMQNYFATLQIQII